MQNAQLYVNDQLLDLPAGSLIALSYAVNSLADLKSVQGNISNTINLPPTPNNRAVLGFPDDMNFNGAGIIRKKLPCRYIQNGVDVIRQGNLRITGTSKGSIQVVLTSGNTDFFDLLTGKLRDLDMHEYDHTWSGAAAMASRYNTSGYIYPIINYGNLSNDSSQASGQGINPRHMRPAVFAKTIVKKVVEQAGYQTNGTQTQVAGYTLTDLIAADPVTNAIYDQLLLPFSSDKFIHSQRYINQNGGLNFQATQTSQLDWIGRNNGERIAIPFNQIDAGGSAVWDGSHWTAPQLMTVDINVSFKQITVQRNHFVSDNSKGMYMKIYKTPPGTSDIFNDAYKIYEPDNLGIDINTNISNYVDYKMQLLGVAVNPGDRITVAFETAGHENSTDVHIYPESVLNISLNSESMLYGETVQVEGSLPDMTASDYLKFISFLFCAIIQTDNINKTVTIAPFSYMVQNIPNAPDWSNKITNDGEDVDLQIGDYCQQNEAKWKHDDTVSPDTYGNASFYIADQNLGLYQDVYDLPFAASFESIVLNNLRTLLINKMDAAFNMTVQTEPRLCLLNKQNVHVQYHENADDGTPTTATEVYDSVPLTYFAALDGSADLTLGSIFKNHYNGLVNTLNDQRKLTCYLKLNEIDIQNLDFFTPVYISKYQCYFYISKITDFTGVKPCKVELIRL